jgi:hypothetical protein
MLVGATRFWLRGVTLSAVAALGALLSFGCGTTPRSKAVEPRDAPLPHATPRENTFSRVLVISESMGYLQAASPWPSRPIVSGKGLASVRQVILLGTKQPHWPHATPEFLLVEEKYESSALAQERVRTSMMVEVEHSYPSYKVFHVSQSVFFLSALPGSLFGDELSKLPARILKRARHNSELEMPPKKLNK